MANLLLQAPLKYEPKTQNRWVLLFPDDVGIQTWAVKSVDTPKIEMDKKVIQFLNTETYFVSSYKWADMGVTIRDFIAPSQSEALMEWVRLHAESVTGRMGYNVGMAKDIILQSLDPTGVATEEWLLKNTIVTGSVEFGSFDYTNSDIRELKFTMSPQYCVHLFG
jgi:hypothetical protein